MLLTEDPARAFARFRQDGTVAECVIFNAQGIGRAALEMFNTFGSDNHTHFVRAILLLDETQRAWRVEAVTADHRLVLCLPLTMKQLCAELTRLLEIQVKH
jgi:hypothetical protein